MIWMFAIFPNTHVRDLPPLAGEVGLSVATHFVPNGVREGKVLYTTFPHSVYLLRDGLSVRGVKILFGKAKRVEPLHPAKAKFSYFKGKDPKGWRKGVPSYRAVAYREVYPGIDLILTGKEGGQLEFQWVIEPGADPGQIALKVEGGELEVEGSDAYVVKDGERVLRISSLRAYQGAEEVEVEHVVEGDVLTYALGPYDPSHTLVIDPDLSTLGASTLLGGSGSDAAYSMALDGAGNVYVAGRTNSDDFPATPGAYDGTYNGSVDVFVAKFSPDLTTLLAATYLGGNDNDYLEDMTLDADGNVVLTGQTYSIDFPTTPGAYDSTLAGADDAFISKLSADLSALLGSTLLGGIGFESGYGVAVDASGGIYVTGATGSGDFPTTPGAYDNVYGGSRDVFVSRFDGGLTTLTASTFLGGSGYEYAYTMTLSGGRIYVTGYTASSNFPTTPGAYDSTHNGGSFDVFVAALNLSLSDLLASTFLGGSSAEFAYAIALSRLGRVYVGGYTQSSDFPITPGAHDGILNGTQDMFVSALDTGLTTLAASTFVGGDGNETALAMAIDGAGIVFVGGWTNSSDFPTTPGAYDTTFADLSDAVLFSLSPDLDSIRASTYLGGSGYDYIYAMAPDGSGNVYASGWTSSGDFPTTPGAYDGTLDGYDAFVVRFNDVFTGASENPEKGNTYSLKDGSIRVLLRSSAYVGASIYAADGRLIDRITAGYLPPGEHVLELPDLPAGTYNVHLRMGQETHTLKLLRR